MDKHTIAVEPESAVPAAVRGSCVSDGVHTSLDMQCSSGWELVGGKTCNK